MDSTDELITWLRVQIDRDLREINPWPKSLAVASGVTTTFPGDVRVYHETGQAVAIAAYMDQQRAIAEVRTKRRILDHVELQRDSAYGEPGTFLPRDWVEVVRILAGSYANRPGYRPEWGPNDD